VLLTELTERQRVCLLIQGQGLFPAPSLKRFGGLVIKSIDPFDNLRLGHGSPPAQKGFLAQARIPHLSQQLAQVLEASGGVGVILIQDLAVDGQFVRSVTR
jgi:hypothetical protein